MIHELRSEGFSISEIGRRLGIDRKTVRKYLQCDRNDVAAAIRQPKFFSRCKTNAQSTNVAIRSRSSNSPNAFCCISHSDRCRFSISDISLNE